MSLPGPVPARVERGDGLPGSPVEGGHVVGRLRAQRPVPACVVPAASAVAVPVVSVQGVADVALKGDFMILVT